MIWLGKTERGSAVRLTCKTRMTRGDFWVAAGILVLAAVLAFALIPREKQGLTVQVVRDGEVLLSRSLEELSGPVEIPVDGDYALVLELSESGVRVKETACPGQDCRHMGAITKAGQQIVCLPNRLVVALQGADSSFDAMTG